MPNNLLADKESRSNRIRRKLYVDDTSPRVSLGLLPDSCFENDLLEIDETVSDFKRRIDDDILASSSFKLTLGKIVHENKVVCEKLSNILHTHNRQIIWNVCLNLNESLEILLLKNLDYNPQKVARYIFFNLKCL